ncbi:MAG: GNAT family N-acetyltransferase [Cryobacterium sp.]|nr:GNAT family N-acetyltransferase [Cryobacterium sp.]MBX3103804.1 GNAT family N-acetyltransferase [Cryobacterium sp.]
MGFLERLPVFLEAGEIRLDEFRQVDAHKLFIALDDKEVWEHIPRSIPTSPQDLSSALLALVATGNRRTFVIRKSNEVVGMTSVIKVLDDTEALEIGATQLSKVVWGTGLNLIVKQLLIGAIFIAGTSTVKFRTDERNERSAAALRKLGAKELGTFQDSLVRRDGSSRKSIHFSTDAAIWRHAEV